MADWPVYRSPVRLGIAMKLSEDCEACSTVMVRSLTARICLRCFFFFFVFSSRPRISDREVACTMRSPSPVAHVLPLFCSSRFATP